MTDPIKVLYVDDNPHDRELVCDALEKEHEGFSLTSVANPEEFAVQLKRQKWDIILTDFNILGYEGLDIVDTAREICPDVPVVVVTGTGSEEVAVQALRRGVADYVIKTSRHIQHLPITLKAILEKNAWKMRTGRKWPP